MSVIVGIDPSLAGTGIATEIGTETVAGDGDERLRELYRLVTNAVSWADLAVVEDLPTHARGAGKTGMAQGVVRLALLHAAVPYVLVTPATVKKFATGKGNASKTDMGHELLKRTGIDLRDDNQVDAWWLRAIGMQHVGDPLVTLPAAHVAALAVLAWPAQMRTQG